MNQRKLKQKGSKCDKECYRDCKIETLNFTIKKQQTRIQCQILNLTMKKTRPENPALNIKKINM